MWLEEIAQEQTGGEANAADKKGIVSSGSLLPLKDRSGREGPSEDSTGGAVSEVVSEVLARARF